MALQILQNCASFDVIAGGETAGIPFAAWISGVNIIAYDIYRKTSKGLEKINA